jgi:hypothetical protein
MFSDTSAVRVFLAPGITDMRKSFNGLYALVRGTLQTIRSADIFSCFATAGGTASKSSTGTAAACGCAPSAWRKAHFVGRSPVMALSR